MDNVREYTKPAQMVAGKQRFFESQELFTQVIFETIK